MGGAGQPGRGRQRRTLTLWDHSRGPLYTSPICDPVARYRIIQRPLLGPWGGAVLEPFPFRQSRPNGILQGAVCRVDPWPIHGIL